MLAPVAAAAEVVAVEVREQRPWIAGRTFGNAGEYELVSGTVRYEIDPKTVSTKDIADIDIAPRNTRGMVEYSGPFMVLRPRDPSRANGTVLLEIANRGGDQSNGILFEADTFDLTANKTREVVRGPLFDRGFTFAWVGWQADLAADAFGLTVPRAPVHSAVRAGAFLGTEGDSKDSGSLRPAGACARDAGDAKAELRLLKTYDDPGTQVPRGEWSFSHREADGTVVADPCSFLLKTPVTAPVLAQVVYEGEEPLVAGLGHAAVRDFAAHLKYRDMASPLAARPGDAKRVIAYGYSQSGRFLRDFLYRGFNADTRGRMVFDGVLDTASGSGRGSFAHRYAAPGQAGNSVGSALRPVDLYPFADAPNADIAGKRSTRAQEGLLDRARKSGVQPKLFHILSGTEYWARAGSLMQSTADGKTGLPELANTRTYVFAGTPHGPRPHTLFLSKADSADYPYNDNRDMLMALPALTEAMRRWVEGVGEPPASRRPEVGTTLVTPAAMGFPAIPKVTVPAGPPPVWQLDLGPDYAARGVVSEPPKVGPRYPLLVPKVDADGNELGGWRGLTMSVPLGTYTAWNRYNGDLDGFGLLSGLQGSFLPFPRTDQAAAQLKDPRASIATRYGGRGGYMQAAEAAIEAQIAAGFLLPDERSAARDALVVAWDRAANTRIHWLRPE